MSSTFYSAVLKRGHLIVLFLLLILVISGCVEQIERWLYGVKPGVTLEGNPMAGMLEAEVRREVENYADTLYLPPKNAGIDRDTGEIIPERYGRRVQLESTVRAVLNAHRGDSIRLRIQPVKPDYTSEDIEKINRVMGSFSTVHGGGTGGRITNIRLAAETINNTLLFPGDVFSFNEIVGDTTYDKGYEPAPILLGDGSVAMGAGGGVCQVSSTIYNVVLNTGLEVVERYPHSSPVGYVPPGRDATIAYPDLDFKFRNSTKHPIIVKSGSDGYSISVRFLGPEEN